MNEAEALHAQIAQRLFGWTWDDGWMAWDVPGPPELPGPLRWDTVLPAYTTDPAATALVWQWVEQQDNYDHIEIAFEYHLVIVGCQITRFSIECPHIYPGTGGTWQEALCRAALALAEALERDMP